MRALVFGSRHYTDHATLFEAMDRLHRKHGLTLVIHGACHVTKVNADLLAGEWARMRGVEELPVRVDHKIDGPWPGAGPNRNRRMFKMGNPGCGVGFGDGDGTRHMARLLDVARVPIWWPLGDPRRT